MAHFLYKRASYFLQSSFSFGSPWFQLKHVVCVEKDPLFFCFYYPEEQKFSTGGRFVQGRIFRGPICPGPTFLGGRFAEGRFGKGPIRPAPLETIRCSKWILGRNIGTLVGGVGVQCHLHLLFDLAVVTLMIKSCLGYILENVKCKRLIHGTDIG